MPDIRDYNLNRWGFVDDSGTLITIASSNVSIDELNSILGTIKIVPNDNNYVLMVNGREAGVISITSQLKLKNVVYNPDTQSIEFTFDSDEGEKKVSVDVHDLIDVYTAGQGLGVDKNQFFIKIDPSSEKYLSVSENGIKISGLDTLFKNLNETLANFGQETAKAFDQINNVLETSINTINGGIDNEIRPAITKNADDISAINEALLNKVEYTDVATSENPGRKAIVLKNHDVILGTTTTGQTNSLVMMSKWDKADFGSASVTLNLNGKDEHPTYNDNKEIAFVDDIPSVEGLASEEWVNAQGFLKEHQDISNLATKDEVDAAIISKINTQTESLYQTVNDLKSNIPILSAKVELLESKVDNLEKSNSEVVETYDGSQELNDEAKVYSISNAKLTNNPSITAKSVILNDSTLTNNARMQIKAENVNINNLQVTGDFPKSTSNSVININDTENIIFKDMTFNSSDVYNGIEIGLSSDNSKLPKNIIFDNCRFEGSFSNNAILIFGTQNNATITLNNCYFKKVSNALRLSNKSNASGVTVNIINCTVDEWDSNTLWSGFLICEDYTNRESEAQAEEANLFSPEKIKVNFINLIHNGEKILPSDIVSVCGSKDENQVVVVCIDAIQGNDYCINYDANKFPTITFE